MSFFISKGPSVKLTPEQAAQVDKKKETEENKKKSDAEAAARRTSPGQPKNGEETASNVDARADVAHATADQEPVETKTEEAFVQAQALESSLQKTLANAPEITAVPPLNVPELEDLDKVVKEVHRPPYSLDDKPQEVELGTVEGMRRGAEAVADVLNSINDVLASVPKLSIIGLFGGGFLAGTYLIAPLLAPFVAGTALAGVNLILISWLAAIAAPFAAAILLVALGGAIGALWGTVFKGKKLRG